MSLKVNFFRQNSGTEPVREWLLSLLPEERKIIKKQQKTPTKDIRLAKKRMGRL